MKSLWYEMGIREGLFTGTVPAVFMNSAYRFFLDLKTKCRQSVVPGYRAPEKDESFTFYGRNRNGLWCDRQTFFDPKQFFREKFTFDKVPMGTPVTEKFWNAETPELTDEVLNPSEKTILGEDVIPSPAESPMRIMLLDDSSWEKQRYRLIQKMRYCIVPLKIIYRTKDYKYKWSKWYEYLGNTGCINTNNFDWSRYSQLRIQIPEYWAAATARCRICITARNNTPYYKVPVEGEILINGNTYMTAQLPGEELWYSNSQLRIFGLIDLATHPDWQKYFDTENTQP